MAATLAACGNGSDESDFFPAPPFFLFKHGKDISIPKGTGITAYVNGDVRLDLAKFQPAAPAQLAMASSSTSATSLSAKIQLESDPAGADIEVDGSFVGNTPSEVQVSDGEHTVSVKKTGFKDWERKLKVSGGSSVHLPRSRRRQRLHSDGCIARRTSLRSARQAQKKREHDSCAPSDFPVICFCFLLARTALHRFAG